MRRRTVLAVAAASVVVPAGLLAIQPLALTDIEDIPGQPRDPPVNRILIRGRVTWHWSVPALRPAWYRLEDHTGSVYIATNASPSKTGSLIAVRATVHAGLPLPPLPGLPTPTVGAHLRELRRNTGLVPYLFAWPWYI